MVSREFCPVCGFNEQEHFLTAKDHSVSGETFSIVRCKSCGFHFTNPVPAADKIGNYYKSDDYVSHSASAKGLINKIYLLVRKYTLRQKVKLVKRVSKGADLLDIGAGTGHFLAAARDGGLRAQGLEPDEDARQFAKQNLSLHLMDSADLHNLPDNSYDVVTMWHVLEHVYNLRDDVAKILDVLRENGVLIVAVPNKNSCDARYYKEFWAAYDLPIHLYHFTPADIRKLFDQFGWEVQEILPMKFDSFYVSMLSEKYKDGNILRAFLTGLKSNWLARNEKYSSQIYILKRKMH